MFKKLCAVVAVACSVGLGAGASAQGCAEDINGDGQINAVDLASVLSGWGYCPGEVTSVTPLHGSILGGTQITINGANLAGTLAVKIDGVACTNLQVLSPTLVKAVTPAGVAGAASIAVISAAGTQLAPSPFTYVQLSISSVSPNQGSFSGGTAIRITGTFLNGATSVKVGGVPATNVVAVDSTTVTAVTPAGSVGAASVEVTGDKGTATASGAFTYFFVPSWATLLEGLPDPAVVTNTTLRNAITATNLPWRVRDNASNIEMLLVPTGIFTMGCSASLQSVCNANEIPTHQVTLTNAFYLGRYEVTQAQWLAEMGTNPSFFQGPSYPDASIRPVERVSWDMLQPFCTQNGLRLPTEAEWEYACRAGTTTAFPNGSNDGNTIGTIAWYNMNSGSQTNAIGGKLANGLGLHDMSGNAYEWTNDRFGTYPSGAQTNPTGPASGTNRAVRSGGWNDDANHSRVSYRTSATPDYIPIGSSIGFRVARNP